MKKQVCHLEPPLRDPFLVSSDMEIDLLRKYCYLENEEYRRYKRSERIHFIAIIVVCVILVGLLVLLITVDPVKIDAFMP